MPNAEKTDKVAALKGRIEASSALLLTEYRGLTVHDATDLRRSLADTARFAIVKNTLMQLASVEAGIEALEALLEGPTAVAFVDGDVVTAAKRVVDAGKKYPALILKGGYLEGRVLTAEEATSLATLESREVMLSRIAGLFKADMSRAAAAFQAVQAKFLRLLDAYKEKLPAPEAPAPEEPHAAAEPEATGEPEATAEAETAVAEPEAAAETTPADAGETEDAPAAEPDASTGADETASDTETENANEEEE
jgi:large subunit ribosomal protein L10